MATEHFGDRLRLLRKEAGLQQRDLGERYGLSASAIGSYERGLREPTLDLLHNLAQLFNVSVDYLLCRTDERLTASAYKQKSTYEFNDFMEQHVVTLNGVVINEKDKQRLCDMALGLFWTRLTDKND